MFVTGAFDAAMTVILCSSFPGPFFKAIHHEVRNEVFPFHLSPMSIIRHHDGVGIAMD